jgi:hypothetical protein
VSEALPRPERSGELDHLRALWRLSLVLKEIARTAGQGDVKGKDELCRTEYERGKLRTRSKVEERDGRHRET